METIRKQAPDHSVARGHAWFRLGSWLRIILLHAAVRGFAWEAGSESFRCTTNFVSKGNDLVRGTGTRIISLRSLLFCAHPHSANRCQLP